MATAAILALLMMGCTTRSTTDDHTIELRFLPWLRVVAFVPGAALSVATFRFRRRRDRLYALGFGLFLLAAGDTWGSDTVIIDGRNLTQHRRFLAFPIDEVLLELESQGMAVGKERRR